MKKNIFKHFLQKQKLLDNSPPVRKTSNSVLHESCMTEFLKNYKKMSFERLNVEKYRLLISSKSPPSKIGTFSLGKKGCAYFGKYAYYCQNYTKNYKNRKEINFLICFKIRFGKNIYYKKVMTENVSKIPGFKPYFRFF